MVGCIYKITEKNTGLIYIGQTHSARQRRAQYRYLASHKDTYHSHERLFTQVIYGSNFDEDFIFDILEDNIDNQKALDEREKYWIKYFDATDPEVGYNVHTGGGGAQYSEDQCKTMYINSKRKKAVYAYDTFTGGISMYFSCSSAGELLSVNDEMVAMAARNITRLKSTRYFMFYVNYNDSKQYMDKYIEKRLDSLKELSNSGNRNSAALISNIRKYINQALDAYHACLLYSKDMGYNDFSKREIEDIINEYRERIGHFKAKEFNKTEFKRPMYVYDTVTDCIKLYSGGAIEISDKLQMSIISVNAAAYNGRRLQYRYHVYFKNPDTRNYYMNKISNTKLYTESYIHGLSLIKD